MRFEVYFNCNVLVIIYKDIKINSIHNNKYDIQLNEKRKLGKSLKKIIITYKFFIFNFNFGFRNSLLHYKFEKIKINIKK